MDEGEVSEEIDTGSITAAAGVSKQVDQSKSNIPIADPEPEDFLELLN